MIINAYSRAQRLSYHLIKAPRAVLESAAKALRVPISRDGFDRLDQDIVTDIRTTLNHCSQTALARYVAFMESVYPEKPVAVKAEVENNWDIEAIMRATELDVQILRQSGKSDDDYLQLLQV